MNSTQNFEKSLAPLLLTVQQVIVLPLSTLSVVFFVYGIYVMVFGLAIHVLLRKKSYAPSRLYITVALFVLASLAIGAYVFGLVYQSTLYFDTIKSKDYTNFYLYLFNPRPAVFAFASVIANMSASIMNIIADWMLIHQCYVIWGFSLWILYPFGLVAFILNGINLGTYMIGSYTAATNKAFDTYLTAYSINNWTRIPIAVFTLILAFTTGGRIWWISSRARQLIGMPSHHKYNAIIQIILESGVLYATFLVVPTMIFIMQDPKTTRLVPLDPLPVAVLMSGLAPTLIIVRVAYGSSINSVQQMISTLHFAESGGQAQAPMTSIIALPNMDQDVDDRDTSRSDLEAGMVAKMDE